MVMTDHSKLPVRTPVGSAIGVVCSPIERAAVRELFELFKTPWGFHEPGRAYDVVIVTAAAVDVSVEARAVLAFGSKPMAIDERSGLTAVARDRSGATLESGGLSVPLHGSVLTFTGREDVLGVVDGGSPAVVEVETAEGTIFRCGYDLFAEVEHLLREGQEIRHAGSPTLDRHIELLRRWLVSAAGILVEIPPVREGHPYAVCLTHDIDFLALRRHRRDRTLLGFLYRATLGSLRDVVSGRGGLRRLARNWFAVATLPLVHLGLRPDPWQPFDSYIEADGAASTFFVIPFRGRGGEGLEPERARRRQVDYDVDDVRTTLRALDRRGYEIAVHGIDAWHNAEAGAVELERVSDAVTESDLGVRMHWLCFEAESYQRLERAGFTYDATCGYNDAVGFRAGTSQGFKPLDAERLLELPLHVQDTALFYPGRLHLSEPAAWEATDSLRRTVRDAGGVLTVSWHDRSLAPERLWDRFYGRLLASLRADGAWFGTARDVVEWFRLRRTVRFGGVMTESSRIMVDLSGADDRAAEAGLLIRVHLADGDGTAMVDVPWRGEQRVRIALPSITDVEALAT